jgi:hypothetical protein
LHNKPQLNNNKNKLKISNKKLKERRALSGLIWRKMKKKIRKKMRRKLRRVVSGRRMRRRKTLGLLSKDKRMKEVTMLSLRLLLKIVKMKAYK